jgi:hypothetical protein
MGARNDAVCTREAFHHRLFGWQTGDEEIAPAGEFGCRLHQLSPNPGKVFCAWAPNRKNRIPFLEEIFARSAADFSEPQYANGWLHAVSLVPVDSQRDHVFAGDGIALLD